MAYNNEFILESNLKDVETEINNLLDCLENEEEPCKREELFNSLRDKQSQLANLKDPVIRKSDRITKPTEKMAHYQETERERKAKNSRSLFTKVYGDWKAKGKETRLILKNDISQEKLASLSLSITEAQNEVTRAYDILRDIIIPEQEIRRQVDTSTAVTEQIKNIIQARIENVDERNSEGELHKILHYDNNNSIFSTVASKPNSHVSSVLSVNRANAAAELAALEAEMKVEKQKSAKQAELEELKRQQVLRQIEIDSLEKEKKLSAARAKFNVYDGQWNEEVRAQGRENSIPCEEFSKSQENAIGRSKFSQPHNTQSPEAAAFIQTLQDSLRLSRLPAPEPMVFTGDPLQYIEWKTNFKTLIESKNLSTEERMFYLKRYLGGPALKAVEGFFYCNSEKSYRGAWNLLEERFGHQFKVQEAFRDKLNRWPKISNKDSVGLQEFGDFLRACQDAMNRVKELSILNDCRENQKLVAKLPEWVASRWNREVSQRLDDSKGFPKFEDFVKFVASEARVACNPLTSLSALKRLDLQESAKFKINGENRKGSRSILATNIKEEVKMTQKENAIVVKPKSCLFCNKSDHHIVYCPKFEKNSVQAKTDFIQQNRLCFGCLRQGHRTKDCKRRLYCQKCKGRHATILHDDSRPPKLHEIDEGKVQSRNDTMLEKATKLYPDLETADILSFKVQSSKGDATSMIVPVWVSSLESPTREVLTYALLDTQSDSTFILEDIASEVSSQLQPTRLRVCTMTSSSTTLDTHIVHDLQVRGFSSGNRIQISHSYTSSFIPANISHIPTRETANQWPHLVSIADELSPLQNCQVGLLIGYNCPQALIPRKSIEGRNDEPYAVMTDLGWSIVGGKNSNHQGYSKSICHRVMMRETPCVSPKEVIKALEADFSERLVDDKLVSQEDLKFISIMEENIHQGEDGHLVMPLPFKAKRPMLPNNKGAAVVRLNHMKKKFIRNPSYHLDYKKFMDDIIRKEDVETVTGDSEDGGVWYLPHHGVYHHKKPEKIRVVFDCSSQYAGTSLNNHLLTGPDMINNLMGILCRFRERPVAMICDIERMFHQFLVNQEDRDYLRFLWWEDGNLKGEMLEYRMKVHLFGAASSPGCANYGLKYLAKLYQNEYPAASTFLMKNFYVDDGLVSLESCEEAVNLVKEAQELCARGGLHLHKFISNSRKVMENIPKSECATVVKDVELCQEELPMERVLGLQWCVELDTFNFVVQVGDSSHSRRSILSIVASIYDPLGFIAPFVLIGKRILQEMCKKGVKWDDPLPDNLTPVWKNWTSDCSNLKNIAIPRCYKPRDFHKMERVELHHFSDASMNGYGQCSYLRLVSGNSVHCTLLIGKARVAPTKIVTIPRLELTAAVISVQVSRILRRDLEIHIDEEFFWTDSKIVLSYINNDARRFHVFVANRIQRIRQLSDPRQWHYVPTNLNPADHASRGVFANELQHSSWFRGPKFLWDINFSISEESKPELSIGDPEVKTIVTHAIDSVVVHSIVDRLTKFSSWQRAISALACLKRAAKYKKGSRILSIFQERQDAEIFIIGLLHEQHFAKEISALEKEKRVTNNSRLFCLNPFLDENNIIRVGGRLKKANLSGNVKHPIILPRDSHITKLIINHFHCKIQHQGRGMTLNALRANGYWILGGARLVAMHIHKCVTCRHLRRPVEEQIMSDLPEERMEPTPPFTFCGIDCFGPFTVKEGRKEIKRYGLLLTCMYSRAVHVEMLDDMSTDSFINSLRCFIALRGPVRQIRCDQGSNFIGARNELKRALNELDTTRAEVFLANQQCEFILNAPCSSHAGGVWERQIRSVRNVLTAMLLKFNSRLDSSSLRTFFYEAMAIVNSRPLAISNLTDAEGPEPITPNHLITMKSSIALPPPGNFMKHDLYLRKRWRRVQYLTEQFWSLWKKEYLLSLNARQKWRSPKRNMKIGDIVLLTDTQVPRIEWPLGVIVETIESADGFIRRVKVKVSPKNAHNGKSESSVLERPIQKLILLIEAK